jgi:hypothetical protein
MTLTLTQSNRLPWWHTDIRVGTFITTILFTNPLKNSRTLKHEHLDSDDLEEMTQTQAILQITFDKDYEV